MPDGVSLSCLDESIKGNKPESQNPTNVDFHDKVEDEYKMRIPKNAKPLLQPLAIQRKTGLNGKVILTVPTLEDVRLSPFRIKHCGSSRNSCNSHLFIFSLIRPTTAMMIGRKKCRQVYSFNFCFYIFFGV